MNLILFEIYTIYDSAYIMLYIFVLFTFLQNCDIQGDVLSSNLSIWANSSGSPVGPASNMSCSNNFRCADSVLFDDEFVPFDASPSSKYGPISKLSKTMIRSV